VTDARAALERHISRWPDHFRRRYRDAGLWTDETVPDMLRTAAAASPMRVAASGIDWVKTYAELDGESERFGAALHALGLQPGERVLFQLGNEPETVVAYYGVVKAGLIPVCSIPQHGERDMVELARQTSAAAYLVQADFRSQDLQALAARVAAVSVSVRHVVVTRGAARDGHEFEQLLASQSDAAARAALGGIATDADDIAVFQLSGGTTGTPKVIARLHGEYVYNSRCWAEICGFGPDSVVMHPIPLIHNAGIAAAMQPSHAVGARLVVPSRPDPASMMSLIERDRVQVIPVMPPALLLRLLEEPRRREFDLSSLTHVIVGGQKLPLEVAHAVEAELGIPCLQMFGMAEGMFMRTPDDAPEWIRKHTVGRPMSPLDEVRILEAGAEDEVDVGVIGELCCRGPYTVRGYFAAPDHNAVAFTSDGFYRTGDLARAHAIDGAVYYSVEGRIKDVINRGAEKINAGEIEDVILAHPAVDATAVVAMPDRALGERACAFVALAPAASLGLDELVEFLLDRGVAKFKLPERLEVVDRLPLTNIGKVDKKSLREQIARSVAAQSTAATAVAASG
jgi:2,3-dihydroxybenzoate-AMP ligase